MNSIQIAGLTVQPGQRAFTRLRVSQLLVGADLALPLHVLHGSKPGPVLGLVGVVHGVEYVSIRTISAGLDAIDLSELAGTILAIPVANPLALSARSRNTPERDSDIANLNRVFVGGVGAQEHGANRLPGDRGTTERIADVISNEFLPRLNFLIDFHHVQEPRVNRVAMFKWTDGGLGEVSMALARAYGCGQLQQIEPGMTPGSITGAAGLLGIPAAVAEVGGGYLPKVVEDRAVAMGRRGIPNIARHLKMLPGKPELPAKQLLVTKRATVRPLAGYLVSDIEAEDLIPADGSLCEVSKGQRLGVVFDPYTLQVVQELTSPVDGHAVVIRRTGLCEAGDRGIAIGIKEHSRWID